LHRAASFIIHNEHAYEVIMSTAWASERAAIVAVLNPINGNNAATPTTVFNARSFKSYMAILQVGVIDQVVDFKLQCSDTQNGTYTDIPGKAITQIPGTGDNTQRIIDLKQEEIPAGRPFVRALVTVGNGTSSLVNALVIGLEPRIGPGTDNDVSTIGQIVR
jgi:hypothetical protein